jgi:uncharacterized protein YbbC (DUF1343 family)
MFEGTTMSEGRGTTKPFETIGAGFLDWKFAAALREQSTGADEVYQYRPAYFEPTFSKFVGNLSSGVEIFVRDVAAFRPIETALQILLAAKEHSPTGEFEWVDQSGADFDLHLGNNSTRLAVEAGKSLAEIAALWEPGLVGWKKIRTQFLLY